MKYLFLFLILIIHASALTVTCNTNKFVTQNVTPSTPTLNGKPYCSAMGGGLVWTNNPTTSPCILVSYSVVTSTINYVAGSTVPTCPTQPATPTGTGSTVCYVDLDVIPHSFKCNPKPSDNVSTSVRCDNTYVSSVDQTIKQCNPNTNVATIIEGAINSKMVNGELEITCKTGYSIDYTANLSVGSSDIPYNTVACIPTPVKVPVSVVDPSTGDVKTTNSDGSTNLKKIDGTIISTDTKGISTTTYPNGSTSISGSYGTASGGTASTSSTITGVDTPQESGVIGATDYVPALVSTSCSSATLTLEQKTLCEINQGIKNQNSELSPQNSINNILRDINTDSNAALSAINKNIKYGNDNLELLNKNAIASNINTNSLNQTGMGIKNGIDSINSTLKSLDENIQKGDEKIDKITEGIDNSMFNDFSNSGIIDGLGDILDNMLTASSEFYSNLGDAYSSLKENYTMLYEFLTGKQNLSHSLNLHAVQIPRYNYTIFGKSFSFDAFLNVDLYSLFAPIRPFVTFVFNIFFITMSFRFILNNFFNTRLGA